MIEDRYIIWYPKQESIESAMIILPGRGQTGLHLANDWSKTFLNKTLIVLIIPEERKWYPMPYSPKNQKEAVEGLEEARKVVDEVIDKISNDFKLPFNRIGLAGFSAGGVMANYVVFNSNRELAASVCHSGAILEPENVPKCKFPDIPFVLTHSINDDAFDWYERFIPMKHSLYDNGYYLKTFENNINHDTSLIEIEESALSICHRLGYSLNECLLASNYFYEDDIELFNKKDSI